MIINGRNFDSDESRNSYMIKAFGDFENPPKISDLEQNYNDAKDSHDSAIKKIDEWLELHEARNKDRGKNRSKTRPKSIKKLNKWTYPTIEEPILAKKNLYDLEPVTYEDEKAARLNEIILNHQKSKNMNFVKFVNDSTRVLVTQGTLIVKLEWVRKTEMIKKIVPVTEMQVVPYEPSPEEQQQLQQMTQQNPEQAQMLQQRLSQMTMQKEVKVGTEVQVVEEQTHNHPTYKVCNYKKVIIDPLAKGVIENAQFVIYQYESNLSDLKKSGKYKNLELLNKQSGFLFNTDDDDDDNFNFKDEPRKRLNIKEYWGFWDINNTGKTEMIVMTYVGNTIIGLEVNPLPINELPFEICHFEPVFESNYGETDAEVIKENQENIGAMTRSIIDITAKSAAGQEARPLNWLDPINLKKYEYGEDYEYNPMMPPKEAIHMHIPPELPNSVWNFIEYQNNEMQEMTGKKPFAVGKGGSTSTATAIRSSLDSTAKRDLGLLRRYTKMLERLAMKQIAMNRLFLDDGQIFKITNDKYIAINREYLYGKFDISIKITTPEETENKINKQSFMLQTMGNTLPFDITKLMMAKIADLENDPVLSKTLREFELPKDPLEEKKKELEIKLLEAQVKVYESTIAENNSDAELNMARVQELNAKAEEIKSKIDMLDLEFIHKSEGIDHIRQLEKGQQKINSDMDIMELKNFLGEGKV